MTVAAPRAERSRDVALAVVRDVFGAVHRAAQAAFDYRSGRAHLDERERAFAAELSYGSIKMRRAIDWYLQPYLGKRFTTIPPTILEILRLGAYQLIFMHGVAARAAVHESVSLARAYGHRGTAGLVNAVLRRLSESPMTAPTPPQFESPHEYLGTLHSFPSWIVSRFAERFPQIELDLMLAALNARPQLGVRVNTMRLTVDAATAELEALGAMVTRSIFVKDALLIEGPLTASALERTAAGRWSVQSESSCMPVDVLDPQPGETILDLCSGRGHKTLHIAARTNMAAKIVAVDSEERKIAHAQHALEEAGAAGVAFVRGDAAAAALELPAADAVLLDAPCSGSGILGRHPEARWRKGPADAERLSELQGRLLAAAAARLRPGGRIVYSVCAVEAVENEGVIDRFLEANPAFMRDDPPQRYAPYLRGGALLVPPGLERRDGFFIARLHRDS